MKLRFISLGLVAVSALAGSGAQAASNLTVGSMSYVTARDCVASNPASACVYPPVKASQITGGLGTTAASSINLGNGSAAQGSVSFGNFALPVIKAAATSSSTERVNTNSLGFQSFRYTGSESINFALTGALHYFSSGHAPEWMNNHELAGEGKVTSYLGIWRMDAISGLSTAQDIINNVFYAPCGAGGVVAAASFVSSGGAGEVTQNIGLSQSCGGGAIHLKTGDEFFVVAGLQTPTNRGGWVNALNTYKVLVDEEKTVYAATGEKVSLAVLQENFVSAAVPEPATWAMMLFGFGAVGYSMRSRKVGYKAERSA